MPRGAIQSKGPCGANHEQRKSRMKKKQQFELVFFRAGWCSYTPHYDVRDPKGQMLGLTICDDDFRKQVGEHICRRGKAVSVRVTLEVLEPFPVSKLE